MKTKRKSKEIRIAVVCTMAMFFLACADTYERVGHEAQKNVFPQGVAHNFVLTYTETPENTTNDEPLESKVVAVLSSPISEDFDNLSFQYRTFPKGLQLEFYDADNNKSIVTSDYGIIYSATNLVDLQGNVVMESHDGKKLEAPQIYWDRTNQWVFTQHTFTYTNPEDGSIMDGEGMDFKQDFSFFSAHKTYGLMMIKEESND
ncbi:LPS export ABC transporter periplasmic protein LptC [Arenibacter sp. GZD96]|uniref:LPS export ABC transporter periplasmic protein LptC n=1 Tax=Aurantibrevibacter litoralis TaxID=3106030 RepID=UPI002AFF9D39|nr:LPS export ABC transporter periplasmic protein LptC [Arenibacter sp. GZD-96]MEA1785598.1 LPS export ABC transporter periplasmic protein LptC [Arenibacter sp. GZD-96]